MPCMLSVEGQWPLLQMAGGCEMDQFCKYDKLLEAGGDVDGLGRWTYERRGIWMGMKPDYSLRRSNSFHST